MASFATGKRDGRRDSHRRVRDLHHNHAQRYFSGETRELAASRVRKRTNRAPSHASAREPAAKLAQSEETIHDPDSLSRVHAETCQEVLDSILMAYRISEDERVSVPVLVNLDGFYLSFTREPVEVPEPLAVRQFLSPFEPKHPTFRASRPAASPAPLVCRRAGRKRNQSGRVRSCVGRFRVGQVDQRADRG